MRLLEPIKHKTTYTELKNIVCKCNIFKRLFTKCKCPAESVQFFPYTDIVNFDVQFDSPTFHPPELFKKLFHYGLDMDYGDEKYRVYSLMLVESKGDNVYSCICDHYVYRT